MEPVRFLSKGGLPLGAAALAHHSIDPCVAQLRLKFESPSPQTGRRYTTNCNTNHFKLRLALFVPIQSSKEIQKALWEIDPEQDFTLTQGISRFYSKATAHPRIGLANSYQEVSEVKIETLVKSKNLPKMIATIKKLHPYETPGFDLIPLVTKEEQLFNLVKRVQEIAGISLAFTHYKIRTCAANHAAASLREIFAKVGAGEIGEYSFCSFSSRAKWIMNKKEVDGEYIESIIPRALFSTLLREMEMEPSLAVLNVEKYPLLVPVEAKE